MNTQLPGLKRARQALLGLVLPLTKTRIINKTACGFLILCGSTALAQAASGTWTNDASSLWSDTTSWLNGIVANGTDATADFSTVNITASRTVTLDSSRSVGNLLFGNPATPGSTNWTLAASDGNVLTLAVSSGSPAVTVTNTATVMLPLAGTSGLTKAGPGTLVLAGTNTYSGLTAVSAGTLKLTNTPSTGPVLYLSFDNMSGSTVFNDGSSGAAGNGIILGTGASIVAGGRYGNALSIGSGAVNAGYVWVPSPVVALNSNATWTVAMWIKTTNQGGVYFYQGDGGWGSGNTTLHLNQGSNDLAGAYAGGVRYGQGWETGTTPVNDGNWHFVVMTCTGASGTKTSYVDGNVDAWTVVNGATMNQWAGSGNGGQIWIGGTPNATDGDVRLNGLIDEVYVYNRALSAAEVTALMNTSATTPAQPILPTGTAASVAAGAKLDLDGNSGAVSSLTGSGTLDTTLTNGAATLNLNNSSSIQFDGFMTNTLGTLSLVKSGAGTLTLTGTNGYAGPTVLGAGALNIDSAYALGGAGTLINLGGTMDNPTAAAITLANNKAQQWAGDVTFTGTANLSFGTGAVTLSGPGTNRTITVGSNMLTVGAVSTASGGATLGLTKAGPGTLFLAGGSGLGLLNINAGTVMMSQDINAVTGLTGAGTLETTGTGVNKWFFINNAADCTFSGTLQNYPGTTGRGMGFNKAGVGAVTLNGTVTINDTFTIQNGTLNLVGTGVAITNINNSADILSVGTVAGARAVLNLSGGATLLANYNPAAIYTSSATISTVATSAGSLQMSSGTFASAKQLAVGPTGYGAFSQSGGTSTIGGFIALGGTTNGGVFNLSGGTVTLTAAPITIGFSAAASQAVLNLSGNAALNLGGAAGNGVWPGEVGTGTLNVSGNAALSITNDGLILAKTSGNGTVNLLGGTVTVNSVSQGTGTGGTFNFNGGTLKANASSPAFLSGLSSAYVYSGGALIDDGGFAITVGQQLQVPNGYGVSTIPVANGGSNYIDTPLVLISGGSGSGATAVASVSGGAVTGITVTCPGHDYQNGDSLTITLLGGGSTNAVAGTPTFIANNSGGLTKSGAGTLTLSGGSTYTGPTVVNGGTLTFSPTSASFTPSVVTVNQGASLAVDASGGGSFTPAAVTLRDNATVSLAYGNLNANPGFIALNINGPLSVAGTNLTIGVSGLGLRPGTFTLIKYIGTALPNLNNFSLNVSAGISATLVNNTGNDSIDLHVSQAPQNLSWYGTVSPNWDINSTLNWKGSAGDAVYLQYTNGSTIVGDAVRFDDTLTNDFVNPQPTNINLTANTFYAFPVVVDSTLPYSFGGPGSLGGTGYLIKTNSGTLTMGASNSYTGGTFVNGGTLIISNEAALGSPSGAVTFGGGLLQVNGNITNTRVVSVTANSELDLASGLTAQLGGRLTGTGNLTQGGNGTLALTGTNLAPMAVNSGTLKVPAGGMFGSTGRLTIGNFNGSNAVLNISGGAILASNNASQFTSGLAVGAVAGSVGDIQMSSGSLSTVQQMSLGMGSNGYGAFTLSGGTVSLGSYMVVGFNNDYAALNQTGGSFIVNTNCLTIGAGGSGSIAVANFSGGTFISTNNTLGYSGGRGGMFVGENGTGVLNVFGSASLLLSGDANLELGRTGTASTGTVNLLGGTISTPQVLQGAGTGFFNFNGGKLKATAANSSFMAGLTRASVFSGGVILDDSGFNLTIAQPLLAPTGYGVASIPVTAGGSGYLDTPLVVITGGSGSNATARATVSGGVVTGIVITSPGTDYASSDGLSVTLYGGGGSGAALGTPVLSVNTSGGFTKLGAGTLALVGANTYSGNTTVSNGMMLVTPLHQVSGAVAISNNAGFGVQASSSSTATVGNLTLGTSLSASNILAFGINLGGANPTVPLLQAGTLTLNGTNTLVRLSGQFSAGSFPLLRYSGAVQGAGTFNTNLLVPQGAAATLSNDSAHSTLYANVSIGASGLVWTGTNSTPGLANVWGLNSITNWLAGSTPTIYQEALPPGDVVNFTDIGSGTVLLSNTVSPAGVVFNNSSVSYTLSGSGRIAGSTGLVKQGTGTVTVNVTNTYTGNTAISNGTYVVGNAAAIPSGSGTGSLILAPLGALDVAGIGATANGFFGSGSVNNSSGTATTLTVGNGDGAGTWSGAIDSAALGGGLSLTKVGTNTLVVSGTNYLRSGTATQVNGGTMIITNGALVSMPSAEFWIAQNANTIATVIVDGGTLVTSNNWLVVGRNANTANGTLIVNHGAVVKAGTNNVVVGSLGATGTLIVNGGQVLNNGMLWLGENATANAYLYLNGGLVQATQIRYNGTTPTNSIAYLNGGTVQATAGSTNFFGLGTMVYIQSGGLVFDDGGFAVTNATQIWQDGTPSGGLVVKQGAGTLYMDTASYYSGSTLVTSGTLAGIGSFSGPVVVGPAGNLGAGDGGATVGALSFNNTLTLQGHTTLRISKTSGVFANDAINVSSPLVYGGTLTINNIGPDALAVGDSFTLFNATGGSAGNFAGISGFPGAGLAYSFDPATGVLSVVAGGPPTTPTSLSFTVSGGTLHLSWPAGYKGWILQSQTNSIGVGITSTNWHDVTGSDALTGADIPANPANGSVFYRLRYP